LVTERTRKHGKGDKKTKNDSSDENYFLNNPDAIISNDWSEFDGISGAIENPNRFLDSGAIVPNDGTVEGNAPSKTLSDNERAALERYTENGYGANDRGEYYNPHTKRFDADYIPYQDLMYIGQSGASTTIQTNPINQIPQPVNLQTLNPSFEPQSSETKKTGGFLNGMTELGKYAARPIWDFDRSGKYNGKRLVKRVAKGVLGTAAGVTAAAVQAGISITDGKYNMGEGLATFAAGYAGVSALIEGTDGAVERAGNRMAEGNDEKQMKRAQARFGDRQDVIEFNIKELEIHLKNIESEIEEVNSVIKYTRDRLGE